MPLKLIYQNILSLAQYIKEPSHIAAPCHVTLAHEKEIERISYTTPCFLKNWNLF